MHEHLNVLTMMVVIMIVKVLAGTLNDCRVFRFDQDFSGLAEVPRLHVHQLDARVFADHGAACQDGDGSLPGDRGTD